MPRHNSALDQTNCIKGFAIASVMINHYTDVNHFLAIQQPGYANGIIALFFVLSGYGVFFSLAKEKGLDAAGLGRFYLRRAVRIFPLYWLSLALSTCSRELAPLADELFTFRTFLAFPLVQAPSLYWFVTSLVQCYLAAPLLYLALRRLGPPRYLILTFLLMLAVSAFSYAPGQAFRLDNFFYRYLFLGHLFFFAFGIALPGILASPHFKPAKTKQLVASFLLFLVAVYFTRQQDKFFPNSGLVFGPVLVVVSTYLCSALLSRNLPARLTSSFGFLGAHSYSIYLLHLFYFETLFRLGLISGNHLASIAWTLLGLPVFLFVCVLLETTSQAAVASLAKLTRSPLT